MHYNIPSGLEERPNLGLGDLLLARLGLRDLQKIYIIVLICYFSVKTPISL